MFYRFRRNPKEKNIAYRRRGFLAIDTNGRNMKSTLKNDLKVNIVYKNLGQGVVGKANKKDYTIDISDNTEAFTNYEENYIIMHELGHLLYDEIGTNSSVITKSNNKLDIVYNDNNEMKANYFAMNATMPIDVFSIYHYLEKGNIERLSHIFTIPTYLIQNRIADLKMIGNMLM